MAILKTTLYAVFMVTVALSKPACLSEGEDTSKSSESSEADSSEESATHVGPTQEPLQPALTGTDLPSAVEQTEPPGIATIAPSASVLPELEDPQTSTDTLQLMPDEPSHTALGVDISHDMPNSDPAQDSVHADTVYPGLTEADTIKGMGGTFQPPVTIIPTYQEFPKGATPPFDPVSTAQTLPIPIETARVGVPVCFTFQFSTPEPDPPRGDSI